MKRTRLYVSGKDLAVVLGCSVRTAYRHLERIRFANGLNRYAKISSLQVAKYLEIELVEFYRRVL
jgi:DNA-binding CsgD family transcriptional regulator